MAFAVPDDDSSSLDIGGLRVTSVRVKEFSYTNVLDFQIWRSGFTSDDEGIYLFI